MRARYAVPAMVSKTSRNDPCPCGSGKKYKKCCLLKEQAEADRIARRDTAMPRALEWLREHHGEAVEDALDEDFFGGLEPSQREELDELPEDYVQMVYLNAFEWLLAEGGLSTGEGADDFAPSMEIVLGSGGASLDPETRAYLELIGSTPMGLYEVVESVPGEGAWLRSTLEEDSERFWIQERAASHSFEAGHIFAGRVLALEPRILSGAIYAFERDRYLELREAIVDGPDGKAGGSDSLWVSACVIDSWLSSLVAPPPEVMDASTGEPVVLTTSRYLVKDWPRLESILADEPNVEHDGKSEWARLEPVDDERQRVLCTLSREEDGHLELFTRTESAADDNAAWIEEIAGEITHLIGRDVEDPRKKAEGAAPEGSNRRSSAELLDEFYRKTYATWADDPLPALADKSPREAVKTDAGKRHVIELLKTYEESERVNAKTQEREPSDLGFLWEAVGLTPER